MTRMLSKIDPPAAIAPPVISEEPVISVESVSKKFCRDLRQSLFYGVQDITTDLVGGRRKSGSLRAGEFWALQNISFQLRPGEALGLVGTNGAGKSTLLRIISGLIKPDTGRVRVRGRIAPLIALGAGFNPILTGRENIYANMSILGLTTKQIKQRFEAVIDFAEIWDAIDAPVQSYSSGMAARLGFACAVYTEPEVLLIDEVLAVGDARFKAKCYRRLYELRQRGISFILVNHNPQAILNTCDSVIYLSQGQLIAAGTAEEMVTKYEQDLFLTGTEQFANQMRFPPKPKEESTGLDIRSIFFRGRDGQVVETLTSGEPVSLCVAFDAHESCSDVMLQLKFAKIGGEDNSGTVLFLSGNNDNTWFEVKPGKHEIQLRMPYLGFEPGTYNINLKLRKDPVYIFDVVESFRFTVSSDCTMNRCRYYQPRSWALVPFEDDL